MYLIRACGTAHLEGARETRWCEKRETLVATWMLFKAVAGIDTENRILTYYDEPASGPGLVAAPSARSNSAPATASLSTPARSRPGDSRTRCDCWYRPPCRCPSPACRTPPTRTWTTSTSAAPFLVPLYTAPCRTATCKSYLRSLEQVSTLDAIHQKISSNFYRSIISLFDYLIIRNRDSSMTIDSEQTCSPCTLLYNTQVYVSSFESNFS